jgi:putative transposase
MPQSHSSLLVHIVFATKDRVPFLIPAIRAELYAYFAGIAKAESSFAHAIGGIEDHVHSLVTLPRTKTLASLVEVLKTGSSKWLKTKDEKLRTFSWQSGYGGFSVSYSQFATVCKYIRTQEIHHRRMNFQDELRAIFRRHAIEFDERYMWK